MLECCLWATLIYCLRIFVQIIVLLEKFLNFAFLRVDGKLRLCHAAVGVTTRMGRNKVVSGLGINAWAASLHTFVSQTSAKMYFVWGTFTGIALAK